MTIFSSSPSHRMTGITLDRASFITTGSAEMEIERQRTVADLLADSRFSLANTNGTGPWRLHLGLEAERLIMLAGCERTGQRHEIELPFASLARIVRDYAAAAVNFYKTAKTGQISSLESLEEDRRSLHDKGAAELSRLLADKAELDKATSRRLFTLIYVLHMRQTSTVPA